MAEERTRVTNDAESLRKKCATLESLVRKMQEQGRALPPGASFDEADDEGTESDLEDDQDYEDGSDEAEYDEDEDDDALITQGVGGPPTFGPVPPPPPNGQIPQVNGKAHAGVNGVKKGIMA